jgi:hypothetical protein
MSWWQLITACFPSCLARSTFSMAPFGDGFQQSYAWPERRGNQVSLLPMSAPVQVNDARPVATEPTAGPEAFREEKCEAGKRRAGFRAKLGGQRSDHGCGPDPLPAAIGPPPRAELTEAPAGGGTKSAEGPNHRVFVGGVAETLEARVHFRGGLLAGSEIRLAASPGAVTAELLTPTNESRQTLVGVMDEVRSRLWRKGVVLSRADRPAPTNGGNRERSHR